MRSALYVLFLTALCATMSIAQMNQPDSTYLMQHYDKHEYRIPMRDGVKLFTAVYSPKDTGELHPFLMTRTPYSVGPYGENRYRNVLIRKQYRGYLERNYIMVFQDVRGKYMSEGTFVDVRPYIEHKKDSTDIDETSDTYDTVDWLIKHIAHNNGKVGVKGISYPGFYTTMATIDAHPAVVATSPQAPVSQWMGGDDFIHNGALLLPHAFDFFMGFGWPRPQPTEHDSHAFNEGTPDEYQFYLNAGALPNLNRLYAHDSVAFWNQIAKHGQWDSFWEARDVLTHVANIKPATMVVGGWYDTENLYGTLHLYSRIKKGNPLGHHTLVIGPWPHNWWGRDDVDSLGAFKFGMNLSDFYAQNIEVPYFDYYLRGKGDMNLPEAYVYETGANSWQALPSWPPVNVKKENLYFCKGGKLSFTEPAPTTPVFDEYVSDPAKPVPYMGEITHWYDASFMLADQRFASERPDVLTYETEPLTDTMTVAGPIEVHIIGSSSGTDCDWIVKLIDVFPDSAQNPSPNPLRVKMGGYQMLVRGDVARGKFYTGLAKPSPLTPGKPDNFNFVMNDVFHRFNKGHRLMVQVQSTWFPMIDRNPGKFENIYAAHDSDFVKTTQRLYRSPRNTSHLSFSVLSVPN